MPVPEPLPHPPTGTAPVELSPTTGPREMPAAIGANRAAVAS